MTMYQLNFINRSSDGNNSSIVIFQGQNDSSSTEEATGLHVIKNFTSGSTHSFAFQSGNTINVAPFDKVPGLDLDKLNVAATTLSIEGLSTVNIVMSNDSDGNYIFELEPAMFQKN
jgi:hypothetical protein